MEQYNLFKNKIIPEAKEYLIAKENSIRNNLKYLNKLYINNINKI